MYRHAAAGAARRACGTGGRAGASGRRGAGEEPSALQIFSAKRARTHYQSFLGVPLIDRGVLQGVLVVQTVEPRIFREDEIRMLTEAAAQVAPVVSEARTLDRFIAPAQERLWALARNLWWSWDHDSRQLVPRSRSGALAAAESQSRFRCWPKCRWRRSSAAPANWCCTAGSTTPTAASRNICRRTAPGARDTPAFCGRAGGVFFGRVRPARIVPIYSGGLGVLAGDHIKSASDLDIPLVGIGLFYGQGYFRQRLDRNGWQQEEYLQTDVNQLPMEPAIGKNGEPVTVQIETRSGSIRAKVWRVKVGRCDLLLLDSNVEGNAPEDRELTSRLYGGDGRMRIRQELLLGVGGFRALKAMGITPGVLHLNEGHSGFAVLEAIRNAHGRTKA